MVLIKAKGDCDTGKRFDCWEELRGCHRASCGMKCGCHVLRTEWRIKLLQEDHVVVFAFPAVFSQHSYLIFEWTKILLSLRSDNYSHVCNLANFTGWSCEGEVELGKLFRRGGIECWCNTPHLNIQVVTVSAVLLSGECKNVSGLTGRFSEGNTWEAFTCMQLTEERQRRRLLWNFRVMFSRDRVVKLILRLFSMLRLKSWGGGGGEPQRWKKVILQWKARFARESHLVVTVLFSTSPYTQPCRHLAKMFRFLAVTEVLYMLTGL